MENLIFNISSSHRDKNRYPDSNKFELLLPSKIKNITYLKLTSIEFPYVFYNYQENRNNVSFKIQHTNNTITDTITISNGNYTNTQLVNTITTKLNEINISRSTNFSISLSDITKRITFINDTEFTLDFSRTGNIQYDGINYSLGFKNNSYTGTSIEGDSVINTEGCRYFFVKINNIDNIYDNNVTNCFAKVLLNTSVYNTRYEGNDSFVSKTKQFRKPENFNKLTFEFVDEQNNLIEFGTHNISLTVELGYIYDIKLYHQIHNNGLPNGDNRLKYLYHNR